MSLIFYYAPMSTAIITRAVIDEMGLDCERVKHDLSKGETRTPAFLKINPNGTVPAIVHDGTAIWESAAIAMYLGDLFGVQANLYPAPGPKRGEAMKWITWSNVRLADAAGRLSAALPAGSEGGVEVAVSAEQRTAEALATAQKDIAECLRILNDALSDKQFLLGAYTLADTHVQGFVAWLGMMGTELGSYANISGWLARCAERPAVAKMMDE